MEAVIGVVKKANRLYATSARRWPAVSVQPDKLKN
jgi:hypothetical protein